MKSKKIEEMSPEELREHIAYLEKLIKLECMDCAEDHSHLEKLCSKYLPDEKVYGDSYAAPGIIDFADMLDGLIPKSLEIRKDGVDIFGECKCPVTFSIESHGTGYALYRGRCCHRHGLNLAFITEADKGTLAMIEGALNHGA